MEAIVFDIPAAKAVIEASVKRLFPDFIVVNHKEDTDDTAMTVYPPQYYYSDLGVDIFLDQGCVQFRMDIDSVGVLPLMTDSDDVAKFVKALIDEEEAARKG